MNKRKGHQENAGYRPNDRWSKCDICGGDFRLSDLKETWDGKMACKHDWEPRQELEPAYRSGESMGTGVALPGVGIFGEDQLQISGVSPAGTEYELLNYYFVDETADNDDDTTDVDKTDDTSHVIPSGTNNNDLTEITPDTDPEATMSGTVSSINYDNAEPNLSSDLTADGTGTEAEVTALWEAVKIDYTGQFAVPTRSFTADLTGVADVEITETGIIRNLIAYSPSKAAFIAENGTAFLFMANPATPTEFQFAHLAAGSGHIIDYAGTYGIIIGDEATWTA